MPTKKTDSSKDKPYVSNYPPLADFLKKWDAQCMWQIPLGGSRDNPTGFVEAWMFSGGRMCIIVVHARQHGWEIYTACDSNAIDATLTDAVTRLKLAGAVTP